MSDSRTPPTTLSVVIGIARREIAIALRRRPVRLLFRGSLLPPSVLGVLLVVRILIQGLNVPLDWDPLVQFITIQATPVLFLALAIGTPSVARDRGEDVLFLYATRPVTPGSYTLGKLAAVAIPSAALLLLPGALIAVLRLGLLEEVGIGESSLLLGKIAIVATLMAFAYAGVSVGASAATKKARWALVIAIACMILPRMLSGMISLVWHRWRLTLDAPEAVSDLIDALFLAGRSSEGIVAVLVLLAWGTMGALVVSQRVRGEMTP